MADKKQPPKRFSSWSFTRWNDYMRCPAFAKYKHLDKVATNAQAHPAMSRGAELAKKSEDYFKKPRAKLPVEFMPLASTYRDIKAKGNLSVEQDWGFTRDWEPCAWNDWDRCFLRVKIDVAWVEQTRNADTLHIRDQKTGKHDERKYEEYQLQLDLYGVAGLSRMPTVDVVTTQLMYSDLGKLHPESPSMYKRVDLSKMQAAWEKRIRPLLNDTRFSPRPGAYCRWCDFAKAKGGPCRY